MKKWLWIFLLAAPLGAQTLTSPPTASLGYCYYAAGKEFLPIAAGSGGSIVLTNPPPASLVFGNYAAGPNYQPLQCDSGGNLIISGGSSALVVGTTPVTSGTNAQTLYDNNGVLGSGGNAATATALAATPSACSGGEVVVAISANGTPTCTSYVPVNPAAAAITGGTIDNTVIGGTTPAAGTFSTLTLNSTGTPLVNQDSGFDLVDYEAVPSSGGTGYRIRFEHRSNGLINSANTSGEWIFASNSYTLNSIGAKVNTFVSSVFTGTNATLTSPTTISSASFVTTGLVMSPVSGNTAAAVAHGHCAITWEQTTGTATVSFGAGMSSSPTNLWITSVINYSAAGAQTVAWNTQTATAATIIGGAATPGAAATPYYANFDFVLSVANGTNVTLTFYGLTSNTSDALVIEPGSYCAWLP